MSESPSQEEAVKLRRVSRPVVIVGALLLVSVMVAAAFVAGLNVRSPEQAADDAKPAAPVTAEVELRVVQEGIQALGKVAEPEIIKLGLESAEPLGSAAAAKPDTPSSGAAGAPTSETSVAKPAAARNVVTVAHSTVGTELAPGDVLAEVSGRPVIAVPAGTPLYRDFSVGIAGEDVRALQQLLADLGYWVDVDGVLDADTLDAFRYWYAQLGYKLAPADGTSTTLPWSELLVLPTGQLTVTAVAGAGTVLGEAQPLVEVRRGSPIVEALIDETQAETFRADSSVVLLVNGESFPSEILAIGDLTTDEATGRSGRVMTVSSPAELAAKTSAGSAVTVASAKPNEPTPAVPITALNEDDKGQYVLAESADSAEPDGPTWQRVDVEVQAVSGGWAAIAELEELPAGSKIRVG